jgi:ubiquinone/menaquinone biosynthesis C-methylase UbiE
MIANRLQRHPTAVLLLAAILVAGLASCTSLKRFAYAGYKRDEWQQPDKVIASMQLQPGDTVADLGAGGGYFTFRLADAVGPGGTVYAVDVDAGLLKYIEDTAREKGYQNITPVMAEEQDAGLPAGGVDLIFVCDTFHHLSNHVEYFRKLKAALRSTPQARGRLVIIEFNAGWQNAIGHGTQTGIIVDEMQQAGYVLQAEFDFLEKQNFLVFQPAQ